MEAQELFDESCSKVLAQGKPAVDCGWCAYRTSDGLACAVGALITDDEFALIKHGGYNGASASSLADHMLLPARLRKHVKLLSALQRCHDSASIHPPTFISSFARYARTMAKELGLDDAVVRNIL